MMRGADQEHPLAMALRLRHAHTGAGTRRARAGELTAPNDASARTQGLVSVVVPCFNQAHFLSEAIESVLAQTYPKVEIIVVDDGSTDNTSAVVERYPGVRCVRQRNQGLPAARNAGLKEASGAYVVFLDADDLLLPDALTVGVRALEERPDVAFVFGDTLFAMDDGSEAPPPHRPRTTGGWYEALLAGSTIMPPACAMFRRSIFDETEPFDQSLKAAEDYELFCRIARRHAVHSHETVITVYRRHGANMTAGSIRDLFRMCLITLHRERRFVWCRPRYWSSYRAGTRYWKLHLGSRLAAEVQTSVARHRWVAAVRGFATLLRWWPRGALVVASSPRRISAPHQWAPES
jgi:glycosyltransferase involved in cell wall biosynthesis